MLLAQWTHMWKQHQLGGKKWICFGMRGSGLDRFLLLVKYYHYCRFISFSHHIPPWISNVINGNWAYIIFIILTLTLRFFYTGIFAACDCLWIFFSYFSYPFIFLYFLFLCFLNISKKFNYKIIVIIMQKNK